MHGLVLGGWIESTEIQYLHYDNPDNWGPSLKRAAGAHRIATFLRQEGWDIEVVDFIAAWTLDEFKQLCRDRITSKTVFVGVSILFESFMPKYINPFLEWLKQEYPHVVTIAGCKHLMSAFNLNCDYYLSGYGEYGLLELLKKKMGKPSQIDIKEMLVDERSIKYVNCDTDHPAFPCRDLQVIYEDRDYILPNEILTLELSRGCKFECKFCSFNVLGVKGDYTVDANLVKEEIIRNYNDWGTTTYTLADETVNDSTQKLEKIAKVCQELPFEVNMLGYIRADLLTARGKTDWIPMSDMGLWGQFYGIESFNHESAKYIKKGMHPDRLKAGILDAKSFFLQRNKKYSPHVSLICGLPYETLATLEEGVSWVKNELKDYRMHLPPLKIQSYGLDSPFKNKYSEFERTWQDDNIFSTLSKEEVLEKISSYPEKWNTVMKNQCIGSDTLVSWEHDTMNIVEATAFSLKYELDSDHVNEQIPSMWLFHQYTTTGRFTLEDMKKTKLQLYKENESFNEPDMNKKFFSEYKRKKLNQNVEAINFRADGFCDKIVLGNVTTMSG